MIEIKTIKGITDLKIFNKEFYFLDFRTRELYTINEDVQVQKLIKKNIDSYVYQSGSIVFMSDKTIYRLIDGSIYEIIKEGKDDYYGLDNFLFKDNVLISVTDNDDWISHSILLLNRDNSIETSQVFNSVISTKDCYMNNDRNTIFVYENNHSKRFSVDITQYGRDRGIDPDNGDILWDNPNEISDELFTDNRNVYIPLKGGQLLALDIETGSKVWMWEHPRCGVFATYKGLIYKQDGLEIFEIKNETGELVRQKIFNNDVLVEDFHASGPLWVYDDIIIVCDVVYGKICLLDRETLEVREFFTLNKKLVNSKDTIIWQNNKLYVLAIDQTLHILEKE